MTLISSSTITLRHLNIADLPILTRYRQNPDVARYQSWDAFTQDQAKAMFEEMQTLTFGTPDNWFQVAIEHREFGMVGDFGLHFVDDFQVEIGVTIDPKWQGKGIGKMALKLLLEYLFDTLGKHRVYAIADVRNEVSSRLFLAANFRREGSFIENCFLKGEWCSEYLYAMLNQEWKSQ